MFGIKERRDVRLHVRAAHRRHYRRATQQGLGAGDAYRAALREVIADRIRINRGIVVTADSREVAAEVIPFLQLPLGKSLEVLSEYVGWREQDRDGRLGYVRAMLAIAFKSRSTWPRESIRALADVDLSSIGWIPLLSDPLQAQLREAQIGLRRRSLQYLQQDAALAV